jgi:type I restriction enzyme S subunit
MTEQTARNVPQIRFKGFEDGWDEKTFVQNITSIQTGTNLLGSASGKGTPLLKMGNIQRGYFSLERLEALDAQAKVESENIVHYGDFLFNTRNTLGLVGKGATWMGESRKFAFNSNLARFKFKGIDTVFFNYLYNTQNLVSQVKARAMGTTSVAAIYPKSLNSLKYKLPPAEEQTQIGGYFRELDGLIGLHQRKHDKLVTLKKAMLQKMFPQPGTTSPEIRFKGFEGDWVVITLGDVLLPHPFKPYLANSYLSGQFDVIQQGDDPVAGRASGIPFQEFEDVIIFGDHTLSLYRPTNPFFVASDGVKILGNRMGLIRDYLYSLLVSYMPPSEGYKRHLNILKAVRLPISLNQMEQQKIGSYFLTLDALITQHATQLQKLQQLKSACLEKMFV